MPMYLPAGRQGSAEPADRVNVAGEASNEVGVLLI